MEEKGYQQFAGEFIIGARLFSYNFGAILARREQEIEEWLESHPIIPVDKENWDETMRNNQNHTNLRLELEEIRAAKMRWELGTYGICMEDDCGIDIPEERLILIPHGKRCAKCQQKKEKSHPSKRRYW